MRSYVLSDTLWTIAVIIALSSLFILTYFTLYPITSKNGTVEQTKTGLDKAINNIESLREESRHESLSVTPGMKP